MASAFARQVRLASRDVAKLAARTDSESARWFSRCERYQGDPVGYCRDILRVALTPQQQQILTALEQPPYQVLVPSANNQGKTFLGAAFNSYRFDCYRPGISLITATTAGQVRDLMFRELRRLRPPWGFLPKEPRLENGYDHFVKGFTAAKADGFQGSHGGYQSITFDEATGVGQQFWDRAWTMFGRHPGHAWLALYNPNDSSSPAFAAEESGLWTIIRLNALEHPNIAAQLAGLPPPIPVAVRLESVLARLVSECQPISEDEAGDTDFQFPPVADAPFPGAPDMKPGQWWRPTSPAFEAQVLGRWPTLGSESLFTPALVDRCLHNSHPLDRTQLPVMGCDVARFGNDATVIAVRLGPSLLHLESHSQRDSTWVAARLRELAGRFGGALATRIPIFVDGTGGYGAGVIDQLPDFDAREVIFSSQSPDPRYLRYRSYLWFRLQEIALAGLLDLSRLPADTIATVRADLTAPRYYIDESNRKVLEGKRQVKARLSGRSTDAGDALALCYLGA